MIDKIRIMNKNKYVANLLVDASQEIIMKPRIEWLNHHHPNKELIFRVGSGKRTYHQQKNGRLHSITFGSKMVESKLESLHKCSRWTTGKEILERNYFNGVLTVQNALAHTVLHEIGHFFQCINGGRDFGSVHNEYFYKVLDKMHNSESPNLLVNYLNEDSIFRNLDFENVHEEPERKYNNKSVFFGDKVAVNGRNGITIYTVVEKKRTRFIGTNEMNVRYSIPFSAIIKKV